MNNKSIKYQKMTAYSAVFVAVTWGGVFAFIAGLIVKDTFFKPEHNELVDIREKHLAQHADEQEQYQKMINLLEGIKINLEDSK